MGTLLWYSGPEIDRFSFDRLDSFSREIQPATTCRILSEIAPNFNYKTGFAKTGSCRPYTSTTRRLGRAKYRHTSASCTVHRLEAEEERGTRGPEPKKRGEEGLASNSQVGHGFTRHFPNMKRLVVGSLALLYSVNAAFGMDEDASGAVEQAPGGEMPGVDPGAGSAAGALGGAGGVGLAGAAGRAAGRAAGALGEAGTAGATPDSLPMASTSIPEEDSETEAEETDEEGKPGKEYEASNSMDPTLSQIKAAESTSSTVP